MLAGKLTHSLEYHFYPKVLVEILNYLQTISVDNFAVGRYTFPFLAEDKAWFVILSYETEAPLNFKPEVHKYFSDLQVMLSGEEKMGWCLDQGHFIPDREYLPERDILFYQNQNIDLNYLTAKPGQFYLFSPSTVHVTNMISEQVSTVKKLVVKIHNDLLAGAA